MSAPVKWCSKCKSHKPATLEFFYPAKGRPDGLRPYCRACIALTVKAKRLADPEAARAADAALYRKCKEGIRERAIQKYWADHQATKEYFKQWRKKMSPETRANINAWQSKWRKESEHYRHRHVAHQQKRRAWKLKAGGSFTAEDIKQKLIAQQNKCFYCESELAKYHADHYIPLAKGGSNDASNIVIACPTCNVRKRAMMPGDFIEKLQITG